MKLSRDDQYLVFTLRQAHSWSKLRSGLELTAKLLAQLDVFPPFLDQLHAFGYRSDDVGDDYQGYFRATRRFQVGAETESIHETTFNIRFPEHNGRSSGSPWSIRHTAFYHQFRTSNKQHIWIMVQPPKDYSAQVHHILRHPDLNITMSGVLSTACFLSTGRYWRDYLVHLQKRISVLENKALFSKVHLAVEYDFKVSFQDAQELQRWRNKILHVRLLLESSAAAATRHIGSIDSDDTSQSALENYTFQLQCHLKSTKKALESSNGLFQVVGPPMSFAVETCRLIEQFLGIVKHRNDEMIRNTNDAIKTNGYEMARLVGMSSAQSEALSTLTRKAQKDSRIVKILSIVAVLYLPATLVASIFNSGLVNTVPVNSGIEASGETSFRLASQFWMFPVVTGVLTCVTLLTAMPWLLRGNGSRGLLRLVAM